MTSAMLTSPTVTVRAPAKVNLELRVGPLRGDGFHPLATVYQAVSLFDDITVRASDEWCVSITGARALGVPADETNLAVRAARALAAAHGIEEPVEILIEKDIPVAGGMAGGSADAAAALVACDWLWGLGSSREELAEIGAELGSDIPFLVHGGTAIGTGRGEVVTPVLTHGIFHWVFAAADVGLPTPAVYAEFDRLTEHEDVPEPTASTQLMAALRSGDPQALAQHLGNDLQGAAISLRPELGELLADGLSYGALGGIVSGSGPTVAFLAADHERAIDLAVALTASGTVTDAHRATGPVHGATLRGVPRAD
ncbi:MAG: 4-(cytidine 5'-diphospho)-2-C-methyl-D-erythritol kinase [Dermatophilaceae bacterium]|nr:4-(cytidine 5'-diphospho)-2-C-methyl-D-erythritol kinase [Intrasporangiaceae bacterium]